MAITREDIAEAVRPVREDIADALAERQTTEIQRIECEALSRYRVYLVNVFAAHAPQVHYLGFAEDGPAFILSEDPKAFSAMARADGHVKIGSAEEAEAYAEVFITTTRHLSKLSYLVKSLSDVSFRPELDKQETEAREAFEAKFGDTIAPPKATESGNSFSVFAFLVVEQDLQKLTVRVGRDGAISQRVQTLARDLPLVMGGG